MRAASLFMALSLSLTLPTSLTAQDGSMDMFMSASNSSMMMTNTIISGETFRASLKAKLAKKKGTLSSVSTRGKDKAPAVQAASLNFTPSAKIRNASVERLFAQMRSVDPENAKKYESQYSNGRFFEALEGGMKVYGFTTNDVADSMSVWLAALWMGANGRSEDLTKAEITAVRNQIADTLKFSPDFAKASDAAKQELSDNLLVNAAVISGVVADPAAKTPEGKAMLQRVTSKIGRDFGFDLTAIKITNDGFTI
jgi:hypothetical protein